MANEDNHVGLSSTVLHVVEQFVAAMRADDGIQGDAGRQESIEQDAVKQVIGESVN